ncbi:MAG: phage portal protein [Planctomycetaceae bacterium]|nr:phage portal protein [Planctomycetaceae bacterium]
MATFKTPDLLTNNAPWMSEAERSRIKNLEGLRQIYEGRHKEYFYRGNRTQHIYKALGPNAANVMYLTENIAGRASLKYADLLCGEPLTIEPEDSDPKAKAAITRLSEQSSLATMHYEAAATASWAGRAYWQVIVQGGVVKLDSITPENIHPRYDATGKNLIAAVVKYVVTVAGNKYVRVIEHTVGKIVHQAYLLDGNAVKARVDLAVVEAGIEEVQETKIDELTVIEVCNFSTGGVGATDYCGEVNSLIDEVNNRRSQISRILDKHGDPVAQALESLFDAQGNLKTGDVLAVDDMSKDAMRYVTWDAKLPDAAASLVNARDSVYGELEMAPVLMGVGGGATSAETWKKFKLQVNQTMARVKRKRLYMSPAVKRSIRVMMLMDNAFGLGVGRYEVKAVSLTWSDGLPSDPEDDMRVIVGYRSAGLLSRKRALMWIHDGDMNVVEEELQLLADEEAASLPTGFADPASVIDESQADPDAQTAPQG